MKHFYSLNDYNLKTFGRKLYKLSISGGFTCPNRDGTKGVGGCIFCSEGGSGDFAESAEKSVTQQLCDAKRRVEKKMKDTSGQAFIAYFQSFTGTYAPTEKLRELFFEAINWEGTAVLSIATRPDCISEETLDLLEELNNIKPVWIELGLQTSNEATAKIINRCYGNEVYESCVRALRARGITVITHMILGLPGETYDDMIGTVKYINSVGTDGIKFQLLHILKGTALSYLSYTTLSMEEYIDALIGCISHLDPETVVHRITGDGPKNLLISPLWSADKKRVLNAVNKVMRERNVRQGSEIQN
ncbi:MAG: TIGR01212 family radical SAM protein [Clostridia bacterium]|nr:TIGR01212 family radical SAM protein [Clostridia bacterium]